MKILPAASLLTVLFLLGACASSALNPSAFQCEAKDVAVTLTPEPPSETLLLVSLDDGSVIMQTIVSSADVCFKKNSESATTCLTQGVPILDPDSNTVIGFEMVEEHIDLVAKSD